MKLPLVPPFILCLTMCLAINLKVNAQKEKRIPVLIVDGFSNHNWQQTTKVTKWMLENSGLFEVEVFTIPTDSLAVKEWNPSFDKYAVVVQNTNNIWEPHLRWPSSVEKKLENYVKKGGGLYILHSANNAFPQWEEYNKMIGLGWRDQSVGHAIEINNKKNIIRYSPGEGESTGHGERFNAVIQKYKEHPINKGYPDKWQTANTEVYYFPRGAAENITILSYAYDSTSTKRMWPVEWVVNYGKGRVYNSSLGHLWEGEIYPPAYRCIGYHTTVIRATEWLGTGKVTYPVPENFPTKSSLSLMPEEKFIQSKQ